MSYTIGTLAGTSGLGTERQVIRLTNGDLWAFGYTGTVTLATWYSQDGGLTWSSGASLTLANLHNGEGRNLGVSYKLIGSVHVVHVGMVYKAVTSLGALSVRVTISGTTATFHSLVTTVASPTVDGDALYWAGIGLELTSDNKVHFSSGYAGGGNGDINVSDSTADAGTSEQMSPVTWASHVVDSSVSNENRSAYVFDTGSTTAGLVADNATSAATCTALDWHTWNGSSWDINDGNSLVTGGTVSAFDKNDWGAVALAANDGHVVYRNASGGLVHRRWDGSSWNPGQTIPAQTSAAGKGVALSTDGQSVWLLVIDTDSANTVRSLRWTSQEGNGIQDAWDASWTAVESTTATRTFLGCSRDTYQGQGLAYWTEGTTLVAVPFVADPPIDPNGTFIQSWQGSSSTSATTFGVTATTQNVVAGNRILVAVTVWNGTATTVTSVTDSAGNAYTKDNEKVESDGTHTSHWSAPITAGGGTKPTVTAHASAATQEWAIHCLEYANLTLATTGSTDGSNSFATAAASSPITSGASTPSPSQSGEIAFGSYGDGGNNIATIGVSAGWTQRGTSIQGTSTTAQQAVADQLSTSGVGSNASFTLSTTGSPAAVLVTVYKLAGNPIPRPKPVPPLPLLAKIVAARIKPLSAVPNTATPISGADDTATGTDAITSIGLTGSDIAIGSDSVAQVGLSASDTATGADAASNIGINAADTASGSDGVGGVGVGGNDTATGTDGVSLIALFVSDTATATDGASAVDLGSTPISAADTASATDAATQIGLTGSDSATASESTSLALSAADTAVGTQAVSTIGLTRADSAIATDATALVAIFVSDSAVATDGASVVQGPQAPQIGSSWYPRGLRPDSGDRSGQRPGSSAQGTRPGTNRTGRRNVA